MIASQIHEGMIREALRQVVDPELDCNIVDLGLVYGIQIESGKVTVTMTLTTPGCPMHEGLAWGVQSVLLEFDGIEEVEVRLVWDPPWSPERMSDVARERVGIG